ncbi:acetolactate synthase [Cytophagia bacterium CHB2]|nr:acetolactate synthase [Cytophagia bacterium CHB2]
MPPLNAGALVAQVLKQAGVKNLFTLCGGHIAPIYLAAAKMGIRVIDTRHEQAAAHAADGWARQTRSLGVVVVTAGPGATDAVTGVANAFFANTPMLVLAGAAPVKESDRGALQEMNQIELFKPLTKWARRVTEPDRVGEYVAAAIRQATSGLPGPVYLELPIDVLLAPINAEEMSRQHSLFAAEPSAASADGIMIAASMLNSAHAPVILGGSNLWWGEAHEAFEKMAAKLNAPIFLNGLARGCIAPAHPLFFQHARKEAFKQADVVVIVGTPLDFRLGYGKFNPKAKLILIDKTDTHFGQNRNHDVGLAGDLSLVLQELTDAIHPVALRQEWFDFIKQAEQKTHAELEKMMQSDALPMNHYRLLAEVIKFIDDKTIVIGDGGDFVACASRVVPVLKPGNWMDPGPFGCLGVGPSFALAAKLAKPDHKVLILHGDGSFGLNGMEFDTAIRHHLPIVSLIGNDSGWGQIRNPQVALLGEKASIATDLAETRYEKMVEALGGYGEWVEKPEEVVPALKRAFSMGVAGCVNVRIDPKTLRGTVDLMRGLSI